MAEQDPPNPLPDIPEQIGPYRIQQLLGHGGMGAVYLARDERLGRSVALKLLHQISDSQRENILVEAKTLARLSHPAIVQLYDVLEFQGSMVMVMEYVEGSDLTNLNRTRSLTVQEILGIAIDISSALAEAHRQGIVHLDLKMANVLLSSSGQVKLTDFGIAEFIDDVKETSIVVGSVPAFSPEQITGDPVDGRSDLFSLGVILYRLLSGIGPFENKHNPRAFIQQLLHDAHLSLSVLRPSLPEALCLLVDQLLEKSPSMRPVSAQDVRVQLEKIKMLLISSESETLEFDPNHPNTDAATLVLGAPTDELPNRRNCISLIHQDGIKSRYFRFHR